jgi:hypothetical protein
MQSVVPFFFLFCGVRFGRFRTEQSIGTPQFGFRELSSHQNVIYSASSLGAIYPLGEMAGWLAMRLSTRLYFFFSFGRLTDWAQLGHWYSSACVNLTTSRQAVSGVGTTSGVVGTWQKGQG